MRNAFVRTLFSLAQKDDRVVLMTGDLGFGVLSDYQSELPEQFLNAGIAEQNMTGVAAGLALCGKNVFTYSIANFSTLRCLEQIRNDVAYHNLNVKIVSIGSGMAYGSSGVTHHATEDIAIMRALPNLSVFSPGDPVEAAVLTRRIYEHEGPCYLRLGKGREEHVHEDDVDFEIGQALPIFEKGDRAVFVTGPILGRAYRAVSLLNEQGRTTRLYSFPTIKPLDVDKIKAIARDTELILTVEEHNLDGGFGGAVAEVLACMPPPHATLKRLGLVNHYAMEVGSQDYLRDLYGLTAEAICCAVWPNDKRCA